MARQLFKDTLQQAYSLMRGRFGHLQWWPGDTEFEICAGAILTQNTNWSNVEKAIRSLKKEDCLNVQSIHLMEHEELAEMIRSAGYFRQKAKCLKSFAKLVVENYGGVVARLMSGETVEVRDRLLKVHGIGPETADSMLLYAGKHVVFVVDAYTRRIFARHGWCDKDASYEDLQRTCQKNALPPDHHESLDYWRDFHAQLVEVGKCYCRSQSPQCHMCPLEPLLPAA
ncbi:MAG: endonuclease III domain-containing protein [Verrucomicrobiota bacterium]|nr:endonuclease III domain-containing protein [Verrucomicrobiota bacterium]